MQPPVYDAPSKQFLLHKLRCSYCKAEGVELTTLIMYQVNTVNWPDDANNHMAPIADAARKRATARVHSLICVECNRAIRKGVPHVSTPNPWHNDPLARIGGQALLYDTTVRIRLANRP